MSVLICFALQEEAAPFHKLAANQSGISIILTGIGKKNAEKSVQEFLSAPASAPAFQLVLTCGFAGGLNPDLKIGDVVLQLQSPESPIHGQLLAAGAKPAKFLCSDRIAITVAEKIKLREQTGADAVEMESAAIHAVCAERGIPCVTVRVISDTAHEDLPLDFNELAKPDKNLDFGKLLFAIAKSPGKIPALMKLRKNTRLAAERLADVLIKVLRPPKC